MAVMMSNGDGLICSQKNLEAARPPFYDLVPTLCQSINTCYCVVYPVRRCDHVGRIAGREALAKANHTYAPPPHNAK